MSRLLAAITLLLSVALTILVTVVCSVPIIIAGIIKLLLPVPAVWRAVSAFCNFMMYCWCEGLAILLGLNPHLRWDIEGLDGLSKKELVLAHLQPPQLGRHCGVMRAVSQTYPDE